MRPWHQLIRMNGKHWSIATCKDVEKWVWEVVDQNNIPEGFDIIDSTWAMKKKVNGNYKACLAPGVRADARKIFCPS